MDASVDLPGAAQHLLSVGELRSRGLNHRAISSHIASGKLLRLRRGWYVSRNSWDRASKPAQHLVAIAAAQADASGVCVFSHRSAATLLGLPVWSEWLQRINERPTARRIELLNTSAVHVITRRSATSTSSPLLRRHRMDLAVEEIVTDGGLRHTSADRTLMDLARSESFGLALVCADILLERMFVFRGQVDEAGLRSWREGMLHYAEQLSGSPGVRAIRALARVADPRSGSPLETMSRLRLMQIGIDVDLQTRVTSKIAGNFYLDFVFRGMDIFGEVDGKVKYTDASMRKGLSPEEIVYREKERQDLIAGSTRMRGVRWGASAIETASLFRERMEAFGVEVPGTPTTRFGLETADFLGSLFGAL